MADPTIENPTTEAGTWETPDGGVTWLLTEPSQAWLDARAAIPEPEPVTRADIEDAFAAALEVADSIEDFRQAARDRNAALAALEGTP